MTFLPMRAKTWGMDDLEDIVEKAKAKGKAARRKKAQRRKAKVPAILRRRLPPPEERIPYVDYSRLPDLEVFPDPFFPTPEEARQGIFPPHKIMAFIAECEENTRRDMAERGEAEVMGLFDDPSKKAEKARKKPRAKTSRLERVWEEYLHDLYPNIIPASWGTKEKAQARKLVSQVGQEVAERTVLYALRNWHSLNRRVFRGKGGVPSIGFILGYAQTLTVEAQLWWRLIEAKEALAKLKAAKGGDGKGAVVLLGVASSDPEIAEAEKAVAEARAAISWELDTDTL